MDNHTYVNIYKSIGTGEVGGGLFEEDPREGQLKLQSL